MLDMSSGNRYSHRAGSGQQVLNSLIVLFVHLVALVPATAFRPASGPSRTFIHRRYRQVSRSLMRGADFPQQVLDFEYLVCCKGKWGDFQRMDAFARAARASLSKGSTIHFLYDDGALLTLKCGFMGVGKPWGSLYNSTSEEQLVSLLQEFQDGRILPGVSLMHHGLSPMPRTSELRTVMESVIGGCDASWLLFEGGDQLLYSGILPPKPLAVTKVLVALGGVRDMRRSEFQALQDVCRQRGVTFSNKSLGVTAELTSKCIKFLEVAKEGSIRTASKQVSNLDQDQKPIVSSLHVVLYVDTTFEDIVKLPIAATLIVDLFLASYGKHQKTSLSLVSREREVLTLRKWPSLSGASEYKVLRWLSGVVNEKRKIRAYKSLRNLLLYEHRKNGIMKYSDLCLLHAEENAHPLAEILVGDVVGMTAPVAVVFAPSRFKPEVENIGATLAAYICASLGHWSIAVGFVRMMHSQNVMATAIWLAAHGNLTNAFNVKVKETKISMPSELQGQDTLMHKQRVVNKKHRVENILSRRREANERTRPLVPSVAPHVLVLVTQGLEDVAVRHLVADCGFSPSAVEVLPNPVVNISLGEAAVGKILVTLHEHERYTAQVQQLQQAAISKAVFAFVAAAEGMAMAGGWVKEKLGGTSNASKRSVPIGALDEVQHIISTSPHWPFALAVLASCGLPSPCAFRASAVSSGPSQVGFGSEDLMKVVGSGALNASEGEQLSVSLYSYDVELFGMLCEGHFACGLLLGGEWRSNVTEFHRKYTDIPFCDYMARSYWNASAILWCSQRLRPSTAMLLLLFAGVQPGDVVLDPFGGIGTIAIEAATHFARVTAITCDAHEATVGAAAEQIERARPHLALDSSLSAHFGDARNLTDMEDGSIDRYVTELTYQRSCSDLSQQLPRVLRKLSLKSLRRFYTGLLLELRRVLRPRSGRCVLLMSIDHYPSFMRALVGLNSNVSGDGGIASDAVHIERVDAADASAAEILTSLANIQTQSKAPLLRLEEKRSVMVYGETAYAIKLLVE